MKILKSIKENLRNPAKCSRNQKQLVKISNKLKERLPMERIWIKWSKVLHGRNDLKNNTQRNITRAWRCMISFKSNKRSRIYRTMRGRRKIIRFYNCLIGMVSRRIVNNCRLFIMCFLRILLNYGLKCFLRCWRSNKSRKRPFATISYASTKYHLTER